MRLTRVTRAEAICPTVGIYRRQLPDSLVSFSSDDGRRLFREAMVQGGCEGYFALAEQFHTQNEPAYCGLGSLAMVLNALNIDDRSQVEKANIKHLTEDSLDVHVAMDVVRKEGITFDEFHCMALLNGAKVTAKRHGEHSYEEFRADVERVCTATPTAEAMVVTFSRKYIGQTGSGHFSPLAALHPASSQALVLDTARFKYPPFWVGVRTMYDSMEEHDSATGRPRGWYLIKRFRAPSVTGVARSMMSWAAVHDMVDAKVPAEYHRRTGAPLPHEGDPDVDLDALIKSVLVAIDAAVEFKSSLVTTHNEHLMSPDNLRDLTELKGEVRETEVYAAVEAHYAELGDGGWPSLEVAALLVLSWPAVPAALTPPARPLLHNEVSFLRERLLLMSGGRCSCPIGHA
eukprot:TRINITY_DN22289_c0_g1_i1.p1 TRINITY_DN22289_c0_g1~~TRINITY_DN22289_c0_g1_i1.p1  ORF type:complete len:402 (+),score=151.70 TRINITY_DN22289_c0_g1_i1:97-1302(+)